MGNNARMMCLCFCHFYDMLSGITIPWFRGVNPVNGAQLCSNIGLWGYKWYKVCPSGTCSEQQEVFTGLVATIPSLTPRCSSRLWVSGFMKPWHGSQAGACKSPWATWWASLLLPQMGALLGWLLPQLYLGQYCFYGPRDLWPCQLFNHSVGPPFSAVR